MGGNLGNLIMYHTSAFFVVHISVSLQKLISIRTMSKNQSVCVLDSVHSPSNNDSGKEIRPVFLTNASLCLLLDL
jgi:hypothetical protein